ncbi:sulfite exporter TauE/SafE family protein [Candidatus Macondimonas diazotrophica]|jgi:hypothetical protein|uniref:sulfite exporter TauE/SafE family protein n=1 Tax=Candidatus Macondimonas diazotrophica TaxID=2305248 RepID=UPI000E918B58|nr:sulfite exporter TauE/SafE family protein [Candidatus Macondimonas diazotrophica]NCU00184.1 urease accessory protein UreH [Candidatus Macondimonas diazotrophica]HBG50730.1 urease accessory protein UreH [Gammaproteobacteria bacterium]
MSTPLPLLLATGFGLGLLHALDPDHVLAVANLNRARAGSGRRASLSFCARWALGHGVALLAIGALVLLAGMAVPAQIAEGAEYLVGWVLIVLGVGALWSVFSGEAPIRWHRHDANGASHLHVAGLPAHHGRRAVAVGLLHGTAGSASLLALAPLAGAPDPWIGMSYLVLFGSGVLLAMMIFGNVLGGGLGLLQGRLPRLASALRVALALAAMGLGVAWVQGGW